MTKTTTLTFTQAELTVLRYTLTKGVTTEALFSKQFDGSPLQSVLKKIG